jgi:hypothetical protein
MEQIIVYVFNFFVSFKQVEHVICPTDLSLPTYDNNDTYYVDTLLAYNGTSTFCLQPYFLCHQLRNGISSSFSLFNAINCDGWLDAMIRIGQYNVTVSASQFPNSTPRTFCPGLRLLNKLVSICQLISYLERTKTGWVQESYFNFFFEIFGLWNWSI